MMLPFVAKVAEALQNSTDDLEPGRVPTDSSNAPGNNSNVRDDHSSATEYPSRASTAADMPLETDIVSPTFLAMEAYVTEGLAAIQIDELSGRIETLTTSCRSALGSALETLTGSLYGDLVEFIRIAELYSRATAYAEQLQRTVSDVEKHLTRANQLRQRLGATQKGRLELEAFLDLQAQRTGVAGEQPRGEQNAGHGEHGSNDTQPQQQQQQQHALCEVHRSINLGTVGTGPHAEGPGHSTAVRLDLPTTEANRGTEQLVAGEATR